MQMPPTDAMRDKSESEPRKGKDGERKEGSGRALSSIPPLPLKPLHCQATHLSSHIYTHLQNTHTHTHKGVQKREKKKNLRTGPCQKI